MYTDRVVKKTPAKKGRKLTKKEKQAAANTFGAIADIFGGKEVDAGVAKAKRDTKGKSGKARTKAITKAYDKASVSQRQAILRDEGTKSKTGKRLQKVHRDRIIGNERRKAAITAYNALSTTERETALQKAKGTNIGDYLERVHHQRVSGGTKGSKKPKSVSLKIGYSKGSTPNLSKEVQVRKSLNAGGGTTKQKSVALGPSYEQSAKEVVDLLTKGKKYGKRKSVPNAWDSIQKFQASAPKAQGADSNKEKAPAEDLSAKSDELLKSVLGDQDLKKPQKKTASPEPSNDKNRELIDLITKGKKKDDDDRGFFGDIAHGAKTLASNAGKDVAEIVTTMPTGIAHTVTHPLDTIKAIPGSYIEIIKDPSKALENPVSTALMFTGAGKVASLGAGSALRAVGKQSLEGGVKRVPGTAFEERVVLPRGAVANARARRKINKAEERAKAEGLKPATKTKQAEAKDGKVGKREGLKAARNQRKAARQDAKRNPLVATEKEQFRRVDQIEDAKRRSDNQVRSKARSEAIEEFKKASGKQQKAMLSEALEQIAKTENALPKKKQSAERLQRLTTEAKANPAAAYGEVKAKAASKEFLDGHKQHYVDQFGLTLKPKTSVGKVNKARAKEKVALGDLKKKKSLEAEMTKLTAEVKQKGQGGAVPPKSADRLLELNRQLDQFDGAGTAYNKAKNKRKKLAGKAKSGTTDTGKAQFFKHKEDAHHAAASAEGQGLGKFVVQKVTRNGKERYTAIPTRVNARRETHEAIGTSPTIPAQVLRKSGSALSGAVLPANAPKWLAGQAGDVLIRGMANGVRPTDIRRVNKAVKEMNKRKPGSGDEWLHSVTTSTHGNVLHDRGPKGATILDSAIEGGKVRKGGSAEKLNEKQKNLRNSKVGKANERFGWSRYSNAIFNLNDKAIEIPMQKAFVGAELRKLGHKGLSDKAIEGVLKEIKDSGLAGRSHLAHQRAVKQGQYGNFSPLSRDLLKHWGRFGAFPANSARFIGRAPKDNPLFTALVAESAQHPERREEKGLSYKGKERVPNWLMGSVPAGDKYIRLQNFGPTAMAADPLKALSNVMLPQGAGILDPLLEGEDWRGKKLTDKDGKPISTEKKALLSAIGGITALNGPANVANRFLNLNTKIAPSGDEKKELKDIIDRWLNPARKEEDENFPKAKNGLTKKQDDLLKAIFEKG